MKIWLPFWVFCVFTLSADVAWAAQQAKVTAEAAEVHQLPNSTSPQLTVLSKDTVIKISSDFVRDMRGEYWYKMRLITGDFGYVRARDVRPALLDRALREAGMDTVRGQPHEDDGKGEPTTVTLRAMGIIGYEFNSKVIEPGGEVEGAVSLFSWGHESGGRGQGMIMGGGAVQILSTEFVVAGSLIYRFYTESRLEPELRIRGGYGITSGSVVGGANFGVRYPFSLDSEEHFDGYLEAGALGSFADTAPVHIFGSLGVGYHF